ncbi:serine protease 1-like [Bactrocera neohumeralis]|uniref:serine protease 1-like n=1 Tax=Bactrocera neohumeralis TaxID=98809 RepID=UPI002166B53B|nr:serine protease 1-like [Bactrocera neohumeralis]
MCSVHIYLSVFVLLQSSQLCRTFIENSTSDGDYKFLVAGGQRVQNVQNFTRFMVSLRQRTATRYFGDNHYCAGVIISYRWIVTSAQCMVYPSKIPRRPRTIIVVIGTENRIIPSNTTRLMAVDRVVVNRNFTLHSTHDIGLIRLKSRLTLNARVQIMPLPTGPPPYGEICIVLGWGRLYYGGPYAGSVSHVGLELFTEERCKKAHPRYSPGDLCASFQGRFDHDPCTGDAGGPLICRGKFVAVVSWTLGCGRSEAPSLYTDIYYNLKWIKSVMAGQSRLSVLKELEILMLIYLVLLYTS